MPESTHRLTAALADRYRIERELGEGGTAMVYLAHDLRHDRRVALKVLKPELAAVLGAERFVVEIRTTASLQHPHILPLFDSGTAEGFLFYVMPFVEGETLRDKLTRERQLGIEESVRIATEVADALQHAHERGVIHRDVKPENILLANGRPMVADFGIALAVSAAAGGRMTETGLTLGTPHYMSPEQATAEKEITARSDVYSLASVLYEMLAGVPPHEGGTAQQTIMQIVVDPPRPVAQLRKSVPPNVAAAVMKALEKVPADRFTSAREFVRALEDPHYGEGRGTAGAQQVGSTGAALAARSGNRALFAAGGIAALAFAVAGWSLTRRPVATPAPVVRVELRLPEGLVLSHGQRSQSLALAPSGAFMVFAAQRSEVDTAGPGGRSLWLRRRNELEVTRIAGTEGAATPFVSPDGKRIGFWVFQKGLFVADLSGGPPLLLTPSGTLGSGGTFASDGSILASGLAGLIRIPPGGGEPVEVTRKDTSATEDQHLFAQLLPAGRGALFTITRVPNTAPTMYDVAVVDLRSGAYRVLTRGILGRYAEGHLVVVRADGVMVAAPFDEEKLALTGPLVPVASGVRVEDFGTVDLALAADGTLLYLGGAAVDALAELVWVSRMGVVTPAAPSWRANFDGVSISPDGQRLAVAVAEGAAQDTWIKEIADHGAQSRITFRSVRNRRPLWFPDGSRLVYVSEDSAPFAVVSKRADGSGDAALVVRDARNLAEGVISPDGQWVVYRTSSSAVGGADLLVRRLTDTVVTALAATSADERTPSFSPDGRWIAYASTESGSYTVFVRPFPNVGDGRTAVSPLGSTEPVWSGTGREIFFVREGRMMAVPISLQPKFSAGTPRMLFTLPEGTRRSGSSQRYDVSPDGERFLMIRETTNAAERQMDRVVFVTNFVEEIRGKLRAP